MKENIPHVTIGQSEFDPFLPFERSKTAEHTDRLRSNYLENTNFENNQNLMKNGEIMS